MKLSEMPIGTALVLKKKKGVNETIDKTIEEGEYFVEVRLDETTWNECKLAEQPKKGLVVKFSANDFPLEEE